MLQPVYEILQSLPYCELYSVARCANCAIVIALAVLFGSSCICSKSSLVIVDDSRKLIAELLPINSSMDDADDDDDVERVRSKSLLK